MKFEYTIKNFEYKENKKIIAKLATVTVCLTIVMTASIVGAFFVKNKIWKKPFFMV